MPLKNVLLLYYTVHYIEQSGCTIMSDSQLSCTNDIYFPLLITFDGGMVKGVPSLAFKVKKAFQLGRLYCDRQLFSQIHFKRLRQATARKDIYNLHDKD